MTKPSFVKTIKIVKKPGGNAFEIPANKNIDVALQDETSESLSETETLTETETQTESNEFLFPAPVNVITCQKFEAEQSSSNDQTPTQEVDISNGQYKRCAPNTPVRARPVIKTPGGMAMNIANTPPTKTIKKESRISSVNKTKILASLRASGLTAFRNPSKNSKVTENANTKNNLI